MPGISAYTAANPPPLCLNPVAEEDVPHTMECLQVAA